MNAITSIWVSLLGSDTYSSFLRAKSNRESENQGDEGGSCSWEVVQRATLRVGGCPSPCVRHSAKFRPSHFLWPRPPTPLLWGLRPLPTQGLVPSSTSFNLQWSLDWRPPAVPLKPSHPWDTQLSPSSRCQLPLRPQRPVFGTSLLHPSRELNSATHQTGTRPWYHPHCGNLCSLGEAVPL